MDNLEKKVIEIEEKILSNKVINEAKTVLTEMKKIGIEELPYSYSALKSFIDPETMKIHYTKHYIGYVEKLNKALKNKKSGDVELENIIKGISKYSKEIRNNAGGAFNHALFWNMLTPTPKKLEGELLKLIIKDFGSFIKFKNEFENTAKERFGSGWVWLVLTAKNKLKIMSTPNQDNPLMNVIEGGGFPLLGLDLWEHAYYLKYRNKRDDYIKNFWKVVNWDFVGKMFEMKSKTKLVEQTEVRSLIDKIEKPFYCEEPERGYFKSLINDPEIKKTYQNGIESILKDVFSSHWVDSDNDEMSGFYGYESEGVRSVLSNLNTNYNTFCLLTRAVNKEIDKLNKPEKKFDFSKKEKRNKKEVQRLINALTHFKNDVFNKENPDFINIMKVLISLWDRGQKTENKSLEKLENYFKGKVKINKTSGHGLSKDAVKGIDLTVNLDDKEYTAQVKPFSHLFIKDGKIKMFNTGDVKKYSVDWLIFNNSKTGKVFIFKNEPLSTKENYIFKAESLLYEIE